ARLGGDVEQAREVVQLTFCRAFESLASYRGECSLYGWFCQICRNAIADTGRQRLREAGPCVAGDDDAIAEWLESLAGPEAAEPEQRLWQSQVVGFVHGALDSLPIAYSDVLE